MFIRSNGYIEAHVGCRVDDPPAHARARVILLVVDRYSQQTEKAARFECKNEGESDGQCDEVIVALEETVQRLILAIFFLQTMGSCEL